MLIVCLGGARSGKSTFALDLARRGAAPADGSRPGGGVTFVATSPLLDDDHDLTTRIEAHRAERPSDWRTIEEQVDLVDALVRAGDDLVVVDCLTVWVGNLVWHGHDDDAIEHAARAAAGHAADRRATTIVVSNEVGSGVHPTTEIGRRYRDVLGRVNQIWAAAADRALLLVAGRALELHDAGALLDEVTGRSDGRSDASADAGSDAGSGGRSS